MKLLANVADTSKDGLISFSEFQAFEGLLCQPDALYKTAFQLFDKNGNGSVTFGESHTWNCFESYLKFPRNLSDEFVEVIQQTELYAKVPFKLDGPFTEAYFGKQRNRAIPYAEFSQFLHDFHEECAMEAFKLKDPKGTGFITALDFQDIMLNVKKHLLTVYVKDNLVQVRLKLDKTCANLKILSISGDRGS